MTKMLIDLSRNKWNNWWWTRRQCKGSLRSTHYNKPISKSDTQPDACIVYSCLLCLWHSRQCQCRQLSGTTTDLWQQSWSHFICARTIFYTVLPWIFFYSLKVAPYRCLPVYLPGNQCASCTVVTNTHWFDTDGLWHLPYTNKPIAQGWQTLFRSHFNKRMLADCSKPDFC